jgi:hypothetical protein
MKSQHCKALTKEQREVLDAAAEKYGTEWYVKTGRHNKIYLAGKMICVISLARDRNNEGRVHPAVRLRQQIEHAMKGD